MEVEELIHKLTWHGEIPIQKWMNFYTKVLARFATNSTLKLILQMDLSSENSFHGKNWKR
jgi:hypothetical protein